MPDITHADLSQLEGRLGTRIDQERAERISALIGIKQEMMSHVNNLHRDNLARLGAIDHTTRNIAEEVSAIGEWRRGNEAWQNSVCIKLDQLVTFRDVTQGVRGDRVDIIRVLGWIVAFVVSLAALYLHK